MTERLSALQLTEETEHGWLQLLELVEFSDEFSLAVLVAADPVPAAVLRDRFRVEAAQRDWRLREVVCAPDETPEHALRALLAPELRDPLAVVWFEAVGIDAHGRSWWSTFASLLNERREVLRRGAMRVLCLVIPERAKVSVRTVATDLWSIVTLAIPVAGAQGGQGLPPADRHLALTRAGVRELTFATDDEAHRAIEDRRDALARSSGGSEELARALFAGGIYAEGAGQTPLAHQRLQESVERYRLLAAERPGVFDADLGAALNELGLVLAALGRDEEALEAATEAVALYRSRLRAGDRSLQVHMSGSLSNFASELGRVGRFEDAVAAAEEALEWARRAASRKRDARQNIFILQHNLGGRLAQMGRLGGAVRAARVSVSELQELALASPEFLPDLALAVQDLEKFKADIGDFRAVLDHQEEAGDIESARAPHDEGGAAERQREAEWTESVADKS